ncbi:MAG: ArsR/SmtB family transcription factor [Paracoccaceae bacterium]
MDVLHSLNALGHEMRLDIFRLLVRAGQDGICAGDLAHALGTPANTLSNNLAILARTGLVTATREGRSIRYRAGMDRMRDLLGFLLADCCGGKPEHCTPLLGLVACAPAKESCNAC